MAEDLESTEDKPCCASLKAKYLKLRTKYSNLEDRKNQFRNAANLVQKQFDSIEKENTSLKLALGDLEARLRDEIEKENGIRGDLEDEVSALKEEIELLKKNGVSGSGGADGKHHECLKSVEEEMNRMKDLFEKEKGRADLEKQNVSEAFKKLEKEKKKVSEAQGVANTEKKNAEKYRLLLEKLKNENAALKSEMASRGDKSIVVDKKLEEEKQETIRARKLAEMNIKKAEDYRLRSEKLKVELDAVKAMLTSEKLKSDSAEAERQEIIKARKHEEMNMKMAEDYKLDLEKMKLELNGVKSMLTTERLKSSAAEKKVESEKQNTSREKNRADDLTIKLEQESTKVKNIEEELRGCICSKKLAKAHAATPGAAKSIQLTSNVCEGTSKDDGRMSPRMKMLLEKDQNFIKEKSLVDSERKKAKKLQKTAKEHKRMALQEKYRADLISKELEGCKLRLKVLGMGPQEFIQYKIFADNCRRCDDNIYQSETVKLLKNQLKLEEMLTKHAKEATKLEVFRNNMLHQELLHLKKECLCLQQRLDMLDNRFLNDSEGIPELEKLILVGNG